MFYQYIHISSRSLERCSIGNISFYQCWAQLSPAEHNQSHKIHPCMEIQISSWKSKWEIESFKLSSKIINLIWLNDEMKTFWRIIACKFSTIKYQVFDENIYKHKHLKFSQKIQQSKYYRQYSYLVRMRIAGQLAASRGVQHCPEETW